MDNDNFSIRMTLPFKFWDLNSDHQAWKQVPLPTKPSCKQLNFFNDYSSNNLGYVSQETNLGRIVRGECVYL